MTHNYLMTPTVIKCDKLEAQSYYCKSGSCCIVQPSHEEYDSDLRLLK